MEDYITKKRTKYIFKFTNGDYRYYVTVKCKDCGLEYDKRSDSLKRWNGRCNDCAKKEVANRPDMVKAHSERMKITANKIRNKLGKNGFKKGNAPWNKGMIGFLEKENHYNWQGGKSFEHYPLEWTKTLKASIRQRDSNVCQLCGIQNKVLCDVHHIDYDKKNLNPTNLICLCKSCHCKTNHKRKYYENYFKSFRKS